MLRQRRLGSGSGSISPSPAWQMVPGVASDEGKGAKVCWGFGAVPGPGAGMRQVSQWAEPKFPSPAPLLHSWFPDVGGSGQHEECSCSRVWEKPKSQGKAQWGEWLLLAGCSEVENFRLHVPSTWENGENPLGLCNSLHERWKAAGC